VGGRVGFAVGGVRAGLEGKGARQAHPGRVLPQRAARQAIRVGGLVPNDHWPDMVEHGIVSNRLFDVLAAGGVVVSDPVGGMHDLLGDIVPTVSDADQLADVVRRLLSDPDEGRQIARRGRDLVLRRTGNRQVISPTDH